MESITVKAMTFRWMHDGLLLTTPEEERKLNALEAYQLLNYLNDHRGSMYRGCLGEVTVTPLYEVQPEYGYE